MKTVFIVLAALVAVLVPLALLSDWNAAAASPMLTAGPIFRVTKSPFMDSVVNIPDPNLRAELRDAADVPDADPIRRSDLAGLTGTLDVSDKEIENAEGIQYCVNIARLDLSRNALEYLPSLAGMDDLVWLNLRYCGLGEWPTGKLPSGLQDLNLSDNGMAVLPAVMTDPCGGWKKLSLRGNGITELPGWLFDLGNLEQLDVSGNELDELPAHIYQLTHLRELNVSDNNLETLPDEICGLPVLKHLVVSKNRLYGLPSEIGYSSLGTLAAECNRISALPWSIGESDSLYFVNVMLNRLTSLPSNFDDKDYDFVNVEFNFMDMSPGSPAREIIDATSTMELYYERQLKPISGLTAEPGEGSVGLAWLPGENGSDADAAWEIDSYVVFLYEGGILSKLADLDSDAVSYDVTGLEPGDAHEYWVGINYRVVIPAKSYDVLIRSYAVIETAALPSPDATASASPASSPDATAAPSAGETGQTPAPTVLVVDEPDMEDAAGEPPDADEGIGNAGTPGGKILLATGIAAGVLILAAGTLALFVKMRSARGK